jgi:para-nitrobenzyl esterase
MLTLLGGGAVAAAADVTLGQTSSAPAAAAGPVAQTTAGKVRGYMNGAVSVFKGIPYAASTAGTGRFSPPKKHAPWSDVRDATKLGDKCPQNSTPWLMKEEAVSLSDEPQSEDCLHLNVWTAGLRDGKKRPVMVWFHGGGFSSGSGGNTRYEGSHLATRQGVVVVTVNHRLNIFGHLYLAELTNDPAFADSGNLGMLDIVAALEWVRDNIMEFGGDPGNVTVFGESGGGGKVCTLMAMPPAKGLFHRVIAQSGLALKGVPPKVATQSTKFILKALGIDEKDAATKLREVPVAKLLQTIDTMKPPPVFAPVVDGRSLPRDPFTPDAPAISSDVPILLGSNYTEVTFFPGTPLDPIDEATLHKSLKDSLRTSDAEVDKILALYRKTRPGITTEHLYQIIASDYWITTDLALQAERKAALGKAPAYVYHFEWSSPARGGKLRSVHSVEIPFVFDNVELAEILVGKGPDQEMLARTLSGAWARFAHTGDPNGPGLPKWAPYSAASRNVMIFDKKTRAEADPRRDERLAVAAVKANPSA